MIIHRVANFSVALMVAVNLIFWLPHGQGQLPSEDATKSASGNNQLDESSFDRKIPIEFRLNDQAGEEIERHVVALGDTLVNKQILVKAEMRRAIVGWNVLVDEMRIDPSMVSVESTEKGMYIFKVLLDAIPSNKLLSITGSPILNEAKLDDNSYFLLNGRVSAQEEPRE